MGRQSATSSEAEELSIVLEAVDEAVDTALAVRLAMPDRPVIDATTRDLVGHLRALMAEDLGFDEDPAVQALFREGYRVLDLTRRPSVESTHFSAYQYMREVGLLTRRFADVYREMQEEDEVDG
ncbi:hypothetical protein OG895_32690 [Streptomyces sp. NBC_00201]|uniref:hypothetical protein n=1 Tax=unclassified Streptomyces TaxID=2593676 RepID=UPI002255C0B6|nr:MULTISPECIES: hypothetical protein [unclassified Streptomyces]MCX5052024.1 hypothetical protein [Streptomyces sp. NBC_00474]MCX5249919.1 hypothetical protein [Streptomyces sp. NBC_00201]